MSETSKKWDVLYADVIPNTVNSVECLLAYLPHLHADEYPPDGDPFIRVRGNSYFIKQMLPGSAMLDGSDWFSASKTLFYIEEYPDKYHVYGGGKVKVLRREKTND